MVPEIVPGATTRTREAAIRALFRLLERERLDDVTVTQLAQEAGIARRTFYLNYRDIREVLREYMDLRFADFARMLDRRSRRGPEWDAIALYSFCRDNAGFLRLLDDNGQAMLLLEAFERALADEGHFGQGGLAAPEPDDDARRYARVAMAAALWRTAFEWVRGGISGTPRQMAGRLAAMLGRS